MVRSSTREHRLASAGFGHMRKLTYLFLSLAVVATACSSDGSVEVASLADTGDATTTDARLGTDEAETEGEPTPHAADAVPAAFDSATCGFGAGLSADRIEIEQIPGDGRQNTVSALNDPSHPSFPEPLVDLNRILSGGHHLTEFRRSTIPSSRPRQPWTGLSATNPCSHLPSTVRHVRTRCRS